MTATVSERIAKAHRQLEAMKAEPYAKHQLGLTLDEINTAIIPARAKVSEALTILRDPALASRMAHASVAAADRLDEAMKWLNGQATVADS
jgi:hypothetical protein